MRAAELPGDGQAVSGLIYRVTAPDETTAIQSFAQFLKESGAGAPAVYGITLASNVTRRTVAGSTSYTVT